MPAVGGGSFAAAESSSWLRFAIVSSVLRQALVAREERRAVENTVGMSRVAQMSASDEAHARYCRPSAVAPPMPSGAGRTIYLRR